MRSHPTSSLYASVEAMDVTSESWSIDSRRSFRMLRTSFESSSDAVSRKWTSQSPWSTG